MNELNFSTLWVSGPISGYEAVSFRSFSSAGLRHVTYSYEPEHLSTLDIEVRDAEEIIPRTEPVFSLAKLGHFALFSDIFRYRLLAQKTTVWVDTDVVVLNPDFFPGGEYVFGFEDPLKVNSAVLTAPMHSGLVNELSSKAMAVYQNEEPKWGLAGPELLTDLISRHNLWDCVSPTRVFYSVLYNEVWKLFSPEKTEEIFARVSESFSLHLWNEVLRGPNGEQKRILPPRESFLDFLVEKFGASEFFDGSASANFFDTTAMRKAQNSMRFRLRMIVYSFLGTVHWWPLRSLRPLVYSLRKWTRI